MSPGEREEAVRLPDLEPDRDLPTGLDMSRPCYWKGPDHWWFYLPRGAVPTQAGGF